MKRDKTKKRFRLRGMLRIRSFRVEMILILLIIMGSTSVLTWGIYAGISYLIPAMKDDSLISTASSLLAATAIATGATALLSKWWLGPLKELIRATDNIAKGDFKVRVQESFDAKSDLGMLQRSFNHMANELDGTEMFKSDFINNFSHEFKTPIVSIQGFSHQLQAGGLSEDEQQEYIRIIASESDRLAKMSSNVLLLSKLENQQIVTDRTEFYLDEQLRTCLLLLEKQWSEKDIELELDLDTATYRFNEDMLSHVWINLFGNAIKFTPHGGKVSCTLRKTPDAITVTVADTGEGMSEEVISHIFEKFYQGDKSHTREGNGVGLTVVCRILELCGGSIHVSSKVGEGSIFTVTLPVHGKGV